MQMLSHTHTDTRQPLLPDRPGLIRSMEMSISPSTGIRQEERGREGWRELGEKESVTRSEREREKR